MKWRVLAVAFLVVVADVYGDYPLRVRGYLMSHGIDPDKALRRGGPVVIFERAGGLPEFYWDSNRLKGLAEPTEESLPTDEEAQFILDSSVAAAEAARQSAKPTKLKTYEKKVIEFLRSEGAIAPGAVKVTKKEIDGMYDAWDVLPGNQGDAKASKYERKLRPVLRNGGEESDVYYHQ